MDMVERISAARHDAYRAQLSEMSQGIIPLWADLAATTRAEFIAAERAGLRELLAPTEQMLGAGGAEFDYPELVPAIWGAMINKMLEEAA